MALPNKAADHERAGNQQREQYTRRGAGGGRRWIMTLLLSVGCNLQCVAPASLEPLQPLEISEVFRSVKRHVMIGSSGSGMLDATRRLRRKMVDAVTPQFSLRQASQPAC